MNLFHFLDIYSFLSENEIEIKIDGSRAKKVLSAQSRFQLLRNFIYEFYIALIIDNAQFKFIHLILPRIEKNCKEVLKY